MLLVGAGFWFFLALRDRFAVLPFPPVSPSFCSCLSPLSFFFFFSFLLLSLPLFFLSSSPFLLPCSSSLLSSPSFSLGTFFGRGGSPSFRIEFFVRTMLTHSYHFMVADDWFDSVSCLGFYLSISAYVSIFSWFLKAPGQLAA